MSSTVAQMFEHSSRDEPEGKADPITLLLRTIDVHSPDIAHVVCKLSEARTTAKYMDYRLASLLTEDVKGFIQALVSLTSVNGKGLKYLTTQTQAYHFIEKGQPQKRMGLADMIKGKPEPKQMGIPIED